MNVEQRQAAAETLRPSQQIWAANLLSTATTSERQLLTHTITWSNMTVDWLTYTAVTGVKMLRTLKVSTVTL